MADIAVIGAGYVGLTLAVGAAGMGHDVSVGERDPDRVADLLAGRCPLFEAGMADLLASGLAAGRLDFTTSNTDAVIAAEVVFLALPTPSAADGSADLTVLNAVVDELAPHLGDKPLKSRELTWLPACEPPGARRLSCRTPSSCARAPPSPTSCTLTRLSSVATTPTPWPRWRASSTWTAL